MANPDIDSDEYVNNQLLQAQTGGSPRKDDPPVWQFNANYQSDPNRGTFEPMRTRTAEYIQVPSSKAKADFHNLDRNTELKRLQELAFQAGLYGESTEREDIPWGSYDDQTFKIWSNLVDSAALAAAAGKRQTVWDKLQDLVEHRPASLGKKKKDRPPLVTVLPDPRELEEMIRSLAPDTIGRDADDALTSDIIAMYTRIQSEYQANKYALANTEQGGTIQAPPSAEALARFRLRTERPEEYEQHRSAERSREYTKLLEGLL